MISCLTVPPAVLPKVFESSLAIVPPNEAWNAIQRARTEQRDAGILRWPPHVNLLYPFVPNSHFSKVAPFLASNLQDFVPFTVSLSRFRSFDRAESSVLYLVPDVTEGPEDAIEQLYARCLSVAPYCEKEGLPFVPHLTVTHTAGSQECAAARASLESWWTPVTFTVDQIHCISRLGPTKPYDLRCRIEFGGGDNSLINDGRERFELMNEPYSLMADPNSVSWSAQTRRGLQERRARGENRKSK